MEPIVRFAIQRLREDTPINDVLRREIASMLESQSNELDDLRGRQAMSEMIASMEIP